MTNFKGRIEAIERLAARRVVSGFQMFSGWMQTQCSEVEREAMYRHVWHTAAPESRARALAGRSISEADMVTVFPPPDAESDELMATALERLPVEVLERLKG